MKTIKNTKSINKRTNSLVILLMLFCVLMSACEKEMEFEGPAEETANDIVINAVAVENEPLRVFLNHAYAIGQQPVLQYIDFQHAMFYSSDYLSDYRNMNYYKNAGIFNAEVTAVVNDSQTYNLALAKDSMGYVCDYHPQVNDHVKITAKYNKLNDDNSAQSSSEATAQTTVPAKPKIEVLKHEVLNDGSYYQINQLMSYSDTIMRITCNISDVGGNQYYRLRIRGERSCINTINLNPDFFDKDHAELLYYVMQDVFFSDDALFVDSRLNKNFGGWKAYFSNVFDNSIMRGESYDFTVDSPMPPAFSASFPKKSKENPDGSYTIVTDLNEGGEQFAPRVMVELQAISPELYRYLKSVELYRVTESDAFSEPLQIYSNVRNGWGIFGSMSIQRLFIPYE